MFAEFVIIIHNYTISYETVNIPTTDKKTSSKNDFINICCCVFSLFLIVYNGVCLANKCYSEPFVPGLLLGIGMCIFFVNCCYFCVLSSFACCFYCISEKDQPFT